MEPQQTSMRQDVLPLGVGGGFLGFSSFADFAELSHQVGMVLGAALVAVTLAHRIYVFWKDAHKK